MAMPTAPQKLPKLPWIGKRPFYGWVVTAVSGMTQFGQGLSSQGFATYLVPLQEQFGWSRAVLAGPRAVTQVESSILGPIEGFLVDRFGPRFMVAVGTFLLGLGLILFGLTNSLWMYFLANIVITLGSGFQGPLIISVTINNWFRRKRSIAQSVMGIGFPMAGIIGIPAIVFMQTSLGWQNSAIITGFVVWGIGLPLSILFKSSPEPYGLLPDGDIAGKPSPATAAQQQTSAEYDFTLHEALRTRAFWLLTVGLALGSLGMGTVQTHLFLHLEKGVGLERDTAAFVWTVASMSNIPARLIGGFFGDRVPKNLILGLSTVILAASVAILGLANSVSMVFVFAVIYGIAWGVRMPVINAIQGEYFGRKSQGVIRGWLQTLSVPVTIAAPVLAGHMADVQGNYRMTFVIISFIVLVGAFLVFVVTRPKPPGSATQQTYA